MISCSYRKSEANLDPFVRVSHRKQRCLMKTNETLKYEKPRVIEYGKVDELTKGGTSPGNETVDGKDEFFKEP